MKLTAHEWYRRAKFGGLAQGILGSGACELSSYICFEPQLFLLSVFSSCASEVHLRVHGVLHFRESVGQVELAVRKLDRATKKGF